jgi:cytochrome bd-type quinol oxidase subunit 2
VDGHPILKNGFVLYEARRPPEPATVPRLWLGLVPIGIALAALLLWMGARTDSGIGSRRALASTIAVLAGVIGLVGLILALLITVTDHVAAHRNENIFMLNPLWLLIAVLGPMMILRRRARGATVTLVRASAALACVTVLLHLVGVSRQPNWDAIGLILPVELALAWVLIDASWTQPATPADSPLSPTEPPAS